MKLVTYLYDGKEAVGALDADGTAVRFLPFTDMNTLVETLDGTFALMGAMKELKNAIETIPDEKVHTVHTKLQRAKTKSDDEVLRDFIASLAN